MLIFFSGAEAGADMAHAFVSHIYGETTAKQIANLLEYVPQTDPSHDIFADIYDEAGCSSVDALPTRPTASEIKAPISHWGILAYPGFASLDAISVAAYPQSIDEGIPEITTRLSVIAQTLDPVPSHGNSPLGGPTLIPTHTTVSPPDNIDVLIVPGRLDAEPVPQQDELVSFIKRTYPKLKQIISVGTGSTLLAASGVLQGRSATTMKANFESLTKSLEGVNWKKGRWVQDGNIWTASGSASGLDAGYALIGELFGEEVAYNTSVEMEYKPRRDASDDPFAA